MPDVPSSENDDLILALSGDPSAYRRLYEKWEPQLLSTAVRGVGDLDSAKSVVQETLTAALAGLHTFNRSSSFKTWVFAILKNKIREHRRKRSQYVLFSDGDLEGAIPDRLCSELAELVGNKEQFEHAVEAVLRLKEELRSGLGAGLEHDSFRRAADDLGVSDHVAQRRFFRAIEKVRMILGIPINLPIRRKDRMYRRQSTGAWRATPHETRVIPATAPVRSGQSHEAVAGSGNRSLDFGYPAFEPGAADDETVNGAV